MQRARIADIVFVAALALLTNFVYLAASNGDFLYPDSATYLGPAENMAHGYGFVTKAGVAETLRTPGYPLFLVPFVVMTSSTLPIVAAQHLMNGAIAAVVYLLGLGLTGSRRSAILGGVIFAIDTPTIHHANKVLSETLFTAALLVTFTLTLRLARRGGSAATYGVAGLLAGALVLIRPAAIAWFIVVAPFLLWGHRLRRLESRRPSTRPGSPPSIASLPDGRKRGVVLFLVTALVLPAGWAARNYHRTGVFTVASIAGVNMLLHRAAGALAVLDDYDFGDALKDRQDEIKEDADDEIQTRLHIADAGELDQATLCGYYSQIGRRIALQHPIGLALLTCRGLLVNLFDSDSDAMMVVSRLPASIVTRAIDAWTCALELFCAVGLVWLWKNNREAGALTLATIVYFLLISAGSEAEARFRIPIVPLIAIAAAAGMTMMKTEGRRQKGEMS